MSSFFETVRDGKSDKNFHQTVYITKTKILRFVIFWQKMKTLDRVQLIHLFK